MTSASNATLPQDGKARRVYLHLRDQIASGQHPDRAVLPGEQRLAASFGVSRVTVRRALAALTVDGLIERRVGSGTRVRLPGATLPVLAADAVTLLPHLAEMGRTSARLLSFLYGPAPVPVCAAMGLDDGATVQIATRVRLIEGQPFSHLTTHVPEAIASKYSETDLAATPLYQLLERGGVHIGSATQSVSAALAAPDVAQALDIATGSALIALRRVVFDSDGRAVEHLAALYRPDLFRLDMALSRVGAAGARSWQPRIGATGDAQ